MANRKKHQNLIKNRQKNTHFEETQEKKEAFFHIKKRPPQSACHGSGRWWAKVVKRGPYL